MICYKDMTFCTNEDCANLSCYRHLSEGIKTKSQKIGLPLCLSDFTCKYSVNWSEEENSFVAKCDEYSSLSWISNTRSEALNGLIQVINKINNE